MAAKVNKKRKPGTVCVLKKEHISSLGVTSQSHEASGSSSQCKFVQQPESHSLLVCGGWYSHFRKLFNSMD